MQQAINASGTYLPADLPIPPIYAKTNPADTPILTLAMISKTLPLTKVEDLADTRLAPKISQLAGVGLVSISGGQKPAVRIQANPTVLASYGLNLEDLRSSIVAANVNQAKGNFDGPHQSYQIGANDQLLSSADYAPLVVAYRNGAPVKLTDVARVVDDAENIRQAAWMNNVPAVIMNIQRQPGANIISVVDRIKSLLPQLTSTLPKSVQVSILTDRTNTIRASVADVKLELLVTIGLVVAVIFLFLRIVSATVIPSVAVPLSLVGTFGVMYLLGYSLNNLTLMALTISTGFVVDDAIVMIENITRYIEQGETPLQAALKGSEQIGFTIMSLTVSLVAVLIPLLFMGDIVGRLFREFAVTLAVTILVSMVVSLTLTPMMCAKLLKHVPPGSEGRFYRVSERAFDKIIEIYGSMLRVVLRFRTVTLLAAVATLVVTIVMFIRIPKGFFPIQDTGVIQGVSEAAQSISFREMADRQQALAQSDSQGPGGGEPLLVHRHRRHQHHAEQRAHPDQPQAARRAQDRRQRRDPPLAAATGRSGRHHPVHAARAGHHGGRPRQPHAVPVHAGRSQRRRAEHLRAADAGGIAEATGAARRGQRPAGAGPARPPGVRSRHGRAPGHYAIDHRPDALRRLRPARSLHHVHAVEPVSRGAGSHPAFSRNPRRSARPFHPYRHGVSIGVDGTGLGRHVQRQRSQRACRVGSHGGRQHGGRGHAHRRLQRGVRRRHPVFQRVSHRRPGAAQTHSATWSSPAFPSR